MKSKIWHILISAILLTLSLSANARVYLVSVGIADYSGYPTETKDLRLPAKDAQTIVDLYSANSSVDYALLVNKKATKSRILKAIKKVFNKAGENDIVVFFFSGHGYAGGFCAYDGYLTYGDVRKAMSKSKCKNKMMFVDACRAGGMRVESSSSQSDVTAAKQANVMLFLSSRNNEISIERAGMKNGFFTTYLQLGLRGHADADNNRIITARELFNYVHREVSQISKGKQHPVMWGSFSDNMPVMQW